MALRRSFLLFTPLFILCGAAIVGVAFVALMGGGGAGAEQITKERMARREDRTSAPDGAAPDNVTPMPAKAEPAQARDNAAA